MKKVVTASVLAILCALGTGCSSQKQVNNTAVSAEQADAQYAKLLEQVRQVTREQLSQVTLNVIDGLYGYHQLEPASLADTFYKVNYIQAVNAGDQMALLLSGQADLNVYGDISFAGIVAADVPLTIIRGMQRPVKPCGIAVQLDSNIQSVQDLKGKIIANTTGYSSEVVAIRAFKQARLNFFKDAQVIEMKTLADARVAFLNKRVDAWVGCHETFNSTILNGEARSLVTGEQGNWIGHNYWGVHHNVFNDVVKLAAILDYVKRVDKSFDWANAHPEELGERIAKTFKSDPTLFKRYMRWSGDSYGLAITNDMIQGLQATYDVEAELGRLPKGKKVAPYFTASFNAYFDATK